MRGRYYVSDFWDWIKRYWNISFKIEVMVNEEMDLFDIVVGLFVKKDWRMVGKMKEEDFVCEIDYFLF